VNIAVTATSTRPTNPVSRKSLALVYIVMAGLAFAISAALESGGMRSPDIADAGAFPFVLTLVAGVLGAWVGSPGYSVIAGGLTGFAYALGGGIVQLLSPGSALPPPTVLTAMLFMTVLGSVLGALGALPFAVMRWRREKKRTWHL